MPLLFASSQSELAALSRSEIDSHAGGHVRFKGTVRASNNNKSVIKLAYEAYESLAHSLFAELENSARLRFSLIAIKAVHRLGEVLVGQTAVIIDVSAAHRHEAFLGARFLIDELKASLPIWKQEFYQDGSMSFDQNNCACDNKLRSKALAPVESALQAKKLSSALLRDARVLLVGGGGLGCPLALNLASLGIGRLDIFDGDAVEERNLARQFVYTPSYIGSSKAVLLKQFLEERFWWTRVRAHENHLTKAEALDLVKDFDLVVEASDCATTKSLLAECARKAQVPFVCASVYRDEGEVVSIDPTAKNGCFSCWQGKDLANESCAATGIFTHTCASVAGFAAASALKLLTKSFGLFNKVALIDTMNFSCLELKLSSDPRCVRCAPGFKIVQDRAP